MKNNYLPKLLAVAILFPLMTLSLNINLESPFISAFESIQVELSTSESHARQSYEPAHLRYETCWTTGEEFLICRYGGGVCDASDQGTCSPPTDPIEN